MTTIAKEKFFVVQCVTGGDLGPYDAVYGYDPIIFRDEQSATGKAEELSSSGDWPAGQPEYTVFEMTEDEIKATFFPAWEKGIAE